MHVTCSSHGALKNGLHTVLVAAPVGVWVVKATQFSERYHLAVHETDWRRCGKSTLRCRKKKSRDFGSIALPALTAPLRARLMDFVSLSRTSLSKAASATMLPGCELQREAATGKKSKAKAKVHSRYIVLVPTPSSALWNVDMVDQTHIFTNHVNHSLGLVA